LQKKYKKFIHPVCRASRSHSGSSNPEDKELSFRYGQIITILDRPSDEWWWGELDDGTKGFFNPNYVWVRITNLNDDLTVTVKDALSCFMNLLDYNCNIIENRVNLRNMRPSLMLRIYTFVK
jgi:hypothetical protein